jgi:hypothetical protein
MAAPLLWLARATGTGSHAFKFLRKLYKGKRGLGERLQRSGMKVAEVTGKAGGKRKMLVPKTDLWSKSKVVAGKGFSGAKQKLRPAGRHLKKHRRAYGWGVTGAAAWDILDRDD